MIEFGHISWAPPFEGPQLALEDEKLGFDIRYFGDNTCLQSDVFGELRDAARATSRIKLATGVTNTVTRDPSAVATSIAAVQVLSGGRAICGIGKGDSAVGFIGRNPQPHEQFEENTKQLRSYLRGDSTLRGAFDSRLEWLADFDYAPVPLEIMCTGPKSIRTAARIADRIMINVGTAPERIDWALDIIDDGLSAAGRKRADVTLGAAVRLYIHDSPQVAAEHLRARVAGTAHMASFPGVDLGAQPEMLRRVTSKLRTGYDYKAHLRTASWGDSRTHHHNTEFVDAAFAAWYGLAGPASYVVERLLALVDKGITCFSFTALPIEEREILAEHVFPHVRKHART